MRVAGADGCPAGWVVADADGVRVVAALEAVAGDYDVLGVDMPIGLPRTWGRPADAAARRVLGRRGVCVFPTPPRDLVVHTDYAAANAESRRRHGQGLTRQSFHLFSKIREVDAMVTAADQSRFAEVHPECSFALLAGSVLAPKRTAAGRSARLAAVGAAFAVEPHPLPGAGVDDVLDAYAVLWSAGRYAAGEHETFGGGEADERGLVMRIVR